jgi:hypothetical protein
MDLPTETRCGQCGTVVALDPLGWLWDDSDWAGANQICRCAHCGAVVFGIVGTEEYVRQCASDAERCVALYRERMLH